MTKDIQTVSSVEVAKMIGKQHKHLMRDIRKYTEKLNEGEEGFKQFNDEGGLSKVGQIGREVGESKFVLSDFWIESTYKDVKGRKYPCYLITRKGCEFIANKLTGKKASSSQQIM